MTETYKLRGCTGCPVKQLDGIAVLDGTPRPVQGASPAYPVGWISISAETEANFGFRLTDAITHDADAMQPIAHCLRLSHVSPAVREWLVTYSLITNGLKAIPKYTPSAYSAIMLGIRGVQKGIEYARAAAHNRRMANG